MTRNANVFREESVLKGALRDIRETRGLCQRMFVGDKSRTLNTDLLQTLEMYNILNIAEATTLDALARSEFRGAHWCEEYQERHDEEWLKHTMLSWNDSCSELWYKPVILEGGSKTHESKTRSY